MTLIEVKPRKWGWCVFESPGVEPVFLEKNQAIGYAETRARLRTGEIRILDSTGNVERVIAFDDANRRLRYKAANTPRFSCFLTRDKVSKLKAPRAKGNTSFLRLLYGNSGAKFRNTAKWRQ
jgi:hypothetical protein